MAVKVGDAVLFITGNSDDLKKDLEGIRGLVAGTLKTVVSVGIGAAVTGIGALTAGLVASTKAAMEAEQIQAQLMAVLKSTGGVAGVTQDAVNELALSLSQLTMFEDDAIVAGQSLLLTFTNIGKDIFPAATEIMLDMSQALGQDLKSSAIQLGKALNDPILGVTALQRVGVSFTQAQRDQIKAMVEAGNVMGAQKMILAELQREFGGAARAAGETFAGQLTILRNALGNMQEQIGEALLPYLRLMLSTYGPQLLEQAQNITNFIIANVIPLLNELPRQIELFRLELRFALENASIVYQGITEAARTYFTYQAEWVKAAIEYVKELASTLWEVGKAFLAVADRRFADAFTAIANALDHATGVTDAATKAQNNLAGAYLGAQQELDWMTYVLGLNAEEYERLRAEILSSDEYTLKLGQDTKNVATAMQNAYTDMGSNVGKVFDKLKGTIGGFLDRAIGAARGLFDVTGGDIWKPGANGPFENLFRLADVAKLGAASPWAEGLGKSQEDAKRILADFQRGILTEEVQALIDIPALVDAAKMEALAEQVKEAFVSKVAALAGVGTTVVDALLPAQFKNRTGEAAGGGAAVAGYADALVGALATTFGNKEDDLIAVGDSLLRGIIKGMEQATADLLKTAEDVANAMIAAIKRALHISSPSQAFAEIGAQSMAGFAQGFLAAGSGNGSRFGAALLNTPWSGAPGISAPISITINAPGGDPAQVAQAAKIGVANGLELARRRGLR